MCSYHSLSLIYTSYRRGPILGNKYKLMSYSFYYIFNLTPSFCKKREKFVKYFTLILDVGKIHPGMTVATMFTMWWIFCFIVNNGKVGWGLIRFNKVW